MNKTKKALLAAVACLTVLSGAFGLAACTEKTPTHSHKWSDWTVTAANRPTDSKTGKATRTCENDGCNASEEDKEYELPALTSADWQKGADSATCSAPGSITYSYDKDDVSVSFNVSTAVNADAHDYGNYVKTNPAGHYQVCVNSPAHRTQIEAHNTDGADGSCSVCGYQEISVELKQEVTVSGASAAAPKLYVINLEGEEYELLVNGNAVDTNNNPDIAISTFDGSSFDEIKTGEQRTLNLTAGKYYIEVYKDLTFKLGLASEHVHAFDESRFEFDENKHWHPAICIHTDEKGGVANHVLSENWSEPDEDGISKKFCECGYEELNYNATAVSGTTSEYSDPTALEVTGAGNFSATIGAMNGWYGVDVAAQYFSLTNSESETKKYTVKILSDNTRISDMDYNLDSIYEKGESLTFLLEAGETFNLILATNDYPEDLNYSVPVMFRVVIEDAPDEGDILRPIVITAAGEQSVAVKANQTVYFKIDHNAFACSGYTLTFGAGVTVNDLGAKITNAGTELLSGANVARAEWSDTYLSVISSEAGELKFELEEYWVAGTKKNPAVAQIGEGKTNTVAVDFSVREQWFKLETETAGKYIIKTNSENSTLELYTDINSNSYASLAESGAPLIVELAANTPVYIRALSDYGEFTFTVNELTDEDKGISAGAPYVLEQSGQFDVKSGNFYYVFNATTDGLITFNYTASQDTLYFWQYSDANYGSYVALGRNSLSINMTAGTTYYIRTSFSGSDAGKFDFKAGAFVNHDYVITVTDGEQTFSGVTVKLTYEVGDVTNEITGATDNGDGTYTFANVDSTKTYNVVINGLPEGFGYYSQELTIGRNVDETTNYTATVIAHKTYTVTFKLPEGVEGVDLSGIQVTATHGNTGTFTAQTNAQGVAVISAVPPYGNSNFTVTVTIPDSLKGSYAYAPERNSNGEAIPLTLTDEANSVEVNLAAVVTYTLALTDGEKALPAGVSVTVNGVTATTDDEGKVTIVTSAGVHAITVGGNWITSTKTTAEGGEITVVCTVALNGSSNRNDAPALPMGSIEFNGTLNGAAYCKFTASEAGTYTFSIELAPAYGMYGGGIGTATLNGSVSDFYNESYDESKFEVVEWSGWYAGIFTVTLNAGDELVLGINNSGTITVEKA